MKRLLTAATTLRLAVAAALSSCIQIGPVPDSGSGGGTSLSQDAGSAGHADAGASTGVACGTDALTGVVLCAATSMCPGVVVDREIYPHCGFRVPSSSIQLECICGDYLCSMGTTLDCTQAANLLAWQTEVLVCSQLDYQRCALRGKKPAASNCDRTCLMGCTGDPACVTGCGC